MKQQHRKQKALKQSQVGEFSDLPADFYKGQTPETFAEQFGKRFREQIRQNAELAAFLEEANRGIK